MVQIKDLLNRNTKPAGDALQAFTIADLVISEALWSIRAVVAVSKRTYTTRGSGRGRAAGARRGDARGDGDGLAVLEFQAAVGLIEAPKQGIFIDGAATR